MANDISSITSSLVKIIAGPIAAAQPAAPRLDTFCTLLKMDRVETGSKARVQIVTTAQAVVENPTTFESAGDTLDDAEATQVHLSAQWSSTNAEANLGLATTQRTTAHAIMLQEAAQAKIYALLTASNYGTSSTVASGSYAKANFQTLLGAVSNRTALVLATPYHVRTERTWFPDQKTENTLQECSTWTGAETNVQGFVARPEAVALPYGLPTVGPNADITRTALVLANGLPAQLAVWWQRSGRAWCASLDVVIAPAIGKSAALRLLKSS